MILPIEVWCLDWTRSFPYPFHIITAGTETILSPTGNCDNLPAKRSQGGVRTGAKIGGWISTSLRSNQSDCFCFICHRSRGHHRCHCHQKSILSRMFCRIDFLIICCAILERRAHGDWALVSFYFCGNCMLIADVAHKRGCVSWKLNEANNFLPKFMLAPIYTRVLICRYESLILYENYIFQKLIILKWLLFYILECYN